MSIGGPVSRGDVSEAAALPPEAAPQNQGGRRARIFTPSERGRATLRILVVTEHPLIGEALTALLERSDSIDADSVASAREAIEQAARGWVHAVVWWADNAGRETFAEVMRVREESALPVCVLAGSVDAGALRDAYQSGGAGLAVILRRADLNARDVLRTVLQLIRGRVVFSPTIIEQLVSDSESRRRNVLSTLTPPELAVLELVAMGLRNAAIARRIGRSQKLVEKHIGRTFAKLGLLMSDADVDRRVTAARIFILATAATEPPESEPVLLDRAGSAASAAGL